MLGKVTAAVPHPVLGDGMVDVPDVNMLEGRTMHHKLFFVDITLIHSSSLTRSRGPASATMNPLVRICMGTVVTISTYTHIHECICHISKYGRTVHTTTPPRGRVVV